MKLHINPDKQIVQYDKLHRRSGLQLLGHRKNVFERTVVSTWKADERHGVRIIMNYDFSKLS